MNCKAEYTDSSVVCARCGWEGRKRRAHNLTESGLDLRRDAYNKALHGHTWHTEHIYLCIHSTEVCTQQGDKCVNRETYRAAWMAP